MDKLKINFIHICDAASIDSTGKLSILSIFSNIFMSKLPGKFHRFTVVMNANLDDISNSKHILNLKLYNPQKEEIILANPINVEFDINKPDSSVNKPELSFILELTNLEFTMYGIHKVSILLDDKEIGEKQITISEVPKIK